MPGTVIGFARIGGGAPSSVRSMTNHLVNQTMPAERQYLAAYYTKGLALSDERLCLLQDMHPAVAAGLGIDQSAALTRKQIDGLLAGRRADGEKVVGKTYAGVRDLGVNPRTGQRKISTPVGSYDFCPQGHKSVSVAFAFAQPAEQAMIFNAHLDASRFAVCLIKQAIGVIRLGDGGKDGELPGHVAALEFTHLTERRIVGPDGKERPGDPGIHTHNLIPNAVFSEDGSRVGSLHTVRVRGIIAEAAAAYNARLAQNLRDYGFDARLDPKTRACVMPRVPQEVCDLFSKRSRKVEAAAREMCGEEVWASLNSEQREAQKELVGRLDKFDNKGGKDDQADFADWYRQAEHFGWTPPESFQTDSARPALSDEQRVRLAYETALPFLAELLEQKSVLSEWEVRAIAGHGLIHAGFRDAADIDAVLGLMEQHGVLQYGERTALIRVDDGSQDVKITTALHESEEREFVALARDAAADRSTAIPARLLETHVRDSGLDFSDDHGKAQLAMLRRLATDGKFTIGIGAAGMGKGEALRPIVSALHAQGRTVYGAAVAHRQAEDLTKAGVPQDRVTALSGPAPAGRTFIEAAKAGKLDLNPDSVVIIDEVAQLGTRQGLELLRLRAERGFTLIAVGDDKQCTSITAGAIVDLARRALGPERVPEILTTKRQRVEAEIRFASLLRQGRAKEALDLKRAAGDAIMVPGGYRATIAKTARDYAARLAATGKSPGVVTPSNRDAHEVSLAIRAERRGMGLLGPDAMHFDAVGQKGHEYRLDLARGDRVRLFQRAKATFASGAGGIIGSNGAVLEVLALDKQGMDVRDEKSGKEARIAWDSLRTSSGRIHLAYGDCRTITSAQGHDGRFRDPLASERKPRCRRQFRIQRRQPASGMVAHHHQRGRGIRGGQAVANTGRYAPGHAR